ncbi:MAG: hypothetical protein ACE5R4_12145 [Armatimonadota bacterium]
MRQQVSPAVVVIVIIVLIAVLAGIWYFVYGRPPAATDEGETEEEYDARISGAAGESADIGGEEGGTTEEE